MSGNLQYNFVARHLVWPIVRAIEETGQEVTFTSIDGASYNTGTGRSGGKATRHTGRMGLNNWTRAGDGSLRRKGVIIPRDMDPPLERAPRKGDKCTALDGQEMTVVSASATAYRDVILAWTIDFQGGAR